MAGDILQNPLMCTYGPSGRGKTVASLRGFSNGLFIGPPGCFLPSKTFLGIDLGNKEHTVTDFDDVEAWIKKVATLSKVTSLVVSDMSILATEQVRRIKAPKSEGGQGIAGWPVFVELEDQFHRLTAKARELPIPVLFEFHEQPGRNIVKKGTVNTEVFVPTCPQIPGWDLPSKLPALFDMVAQVVESPDLLSYHVWPYGFATGPSGDAVRKDRTNIFPPTFPLNLREGFHAAGVDIPRHEAVKWIEPHVETLANKLAELRAADQLTNETTKEVLREVYTEHKDKNSKHVRWLILDGYDRAELKHHHAHAIDNLIDNLTRKIDSKE